MVYKQFVLFRLGSQEFAVDINMVNTIEKVAQITRVPGAKPYVKGVINLRGEVVPVIDGRKRLAIGGDEQHDEDRIIIVKADDIEVGIIADSASEVVRIPVQDIDKNLGYTKNLDDTFIEGVGKIGDRIVIILNLKNLLEIA